MQRAMSLGKWLYHAGFWWAFVTDVWYLSTRIQKRCGAR